MQLCKWNASMRCIEILATDGGYADVSAVFRSMQGTQFKLVITKQYDPYSIPQKVWDTSMGMQPPSMGSDIGPAMPPSPFTAQTISKYRVNGTPSDLALVKPSFFQPMPPPFPPTPIGMPTPPPPPPPNGQPPPPMGQVPIYTDYTINPSLTATLEPSTGDPNTLVYFYRFTFRMSPFDDTNVIVVSVEDSNAAGGGPPAP
jgi:hypothetical protein